MDKKWLQKEMDRVEYYQKMKDARKNNKPLPKRPKGVPNPAKDPLIRSSGRKR